MKLHSIDSQRSKRFDFIVVGAGSAGCVVASRLAEKNPNVSVLLVEAGDHATELEVKMPIACGTVRKKAFISAVK